MTHNVTSTEGGRFDFNDGGCYIGEWADGRAHGLGIATGPEDNPGEYAGEWILGFESLGVYVWMSGSVYEGRWMKGKRHGEGVQIQGRWRYQGEFTTGFCGRYGVRESLNSCAKYEGSWNLNQFDGFGIETNSDGSTYAGGWTKGLRSGLGVRKSVTYDRAADLSSGLHIRANASQTSIGIGTNEPDVAIMPKDLFSSDHAGRHLEGHKNGFVLVGEASARLHPHHKKGILEKSSGIFSRGIFKKLRKQKSTGDLRSTNSAYNAGRAGGSLRSTFSGTSQMTNQSMPVHGQYLDVLSANHALQIPGPTSLGSPNTIPSVTSHLLQETPIASNVTETYMGQWLEDRRTGYGVAERSDGLRFEGEWLNNKKNGYGCTYFPDGTKEEGRYRNNQLVAPLNRKNKLLLLRGSRVRDAVDAAVSKAQQMAKDALTKSQESAIQRSQTARMAATSAANAAKEARRACELARALAREFAPDFVQQGPVWEAARQNGGTIIPSTIEKAKTSPTKQSFTNKTQRGPMAGNSDRTGSISPTHLKADDVERSNTGECLEVSGGSRRGSFRSSFRRNRAEGADATVQKESSVSNPPFLTDSKSTSQQGTRTMNQPTVSPLQRSARKELSPPPSVAQKATPQKQDQHLLHPASNSSDSHESRTTLSRTPHYANKSSSHSPMNKNSASQVLDKREVHPTTAATVQRTPLKPAPVTTPKKRDLSPPAVSQVRSRKTLPTDTDSPTRTSSQITPFRNPNPRLRSTPYKDLDSYQTFSDPFSRQLHGGVIDYHVPEVKEMLQQQQNQRRRSEPSIMTTKPVPLITKTRNGKELPAHRTNWYHNVEQTTFLIDYGLQKRLISEKTHQFQRQRSIRRKYSLQIEGDEMPQLPRNYTFLSQIPLRKDLGLGSLPEISICYEKLSRVGTWSREEILQLCQAQRKKRLLMEERRKKGEIVIRLADLKDWMKKNYWLMLLCAMNLLLALIFLSLLRDTDVVTAD